jgi:ankyrin repeat protein
MNAKAADGATPLHAAVHRGHVEVIKALVHLGADMQAKLEGATPLQFSLILGFQQVAQLLRELERAARTQKAAATSERAQQAAEQADRVGAALLEEEEREQAAKAQSKVRGVTLSHTFG